MIVEMTKDNLELISQFEKTFSTFFSCKNKINDDFRNNSFSKYFIYVEKSNIIGFVNYYDIYERFEIANIYVIPEHRNQQVGLKLLECVINIGFKKNIKNITLEVKIDNIYAIKLYEKCGFKKVALRKNYYDGIDGILMERKMM